MKEAKQDNWNLRCPRDFKSGADFGEMRRPKRSNFVAQTEDVWGV